MPKKENFKNKLLTVFGFLFAIGITSYFLFRDTHEWVADIIPEFLGILLLGFFITYALKQGTNFKNYIIIISIAVIVSIIGYVYGLQTNTRVLVDLAPELLGSTGLSLVLSLIFKRKVWR